MKWGLVKVFAIALLAAGLLQPLAAHAHFQTRSPTAAACTSFDLGNPNWLNPDRAASSNNQFATSTVDDNQATDGLVCVQYGFTIPATATILGIILRIERRTSTVAGVSPTQDSIVRLIKGGAATAVDRSTTTAYTTADVVEDHGTSLDLWGTTWTAADVNDPNFGAAFAAFKNGTTGGTVTVSVDHMQIEVHYNQAPPAPALSSPADGATDTTGIPAFDWADVTDPDADTVTYEVEADNNGCGFASPEVSQTGLATSNFTPGAALTDGTYCWRARAVDEHGIAGPWSATRDVTVSVAGTPGSQTMSPNAAADCTSLGGGGANWTTAGNAASSNNQRATATVDGTVTDPLQCLDYRFTIPATATILGIEVRLERGSSSTANGGSRDNSLFLVKAGSAAGGNGATTTIYGTTEAVEVHGGPTNLWGTTWTPAQINAANFGAVYTGTKPSSAGGSHLISVDHIEITVYYFIPAVVPGSFNAFETSTAANAITGQIFMKRVGTNFAVDVVAISSGAQLAFTNTVQVDLVTGSTGGANCPGTPVTIAGTTQSVSLTSGRGTTGNFSLASPAPDARLRIRYPVASPTVTSCSTDNFSIRPSSITVTSTNATNNGASGTPTFATGANFNLTAATVAGYTGTPTINNTQVIGSPNAGTLGGSFTAAVAGTGTATGNSFFYSEVGNFGLNANAVYDSTYTAVDQPNDCIAGFSNALAGGKYGCSFGSAAIAMTVGTSGFGRFIPDNFNVTYNTPTFTTSCASGTFTYVGQSLPYASAPQMTVIARSGTANGLTNTTTANYAGAYMKLSNALGTSLNKAAYDTQQERYARFDALGGLLTPVLDTAVLPATTTDPAIGAFTNGVGTLTFASGLAFVRSATTPSALFDADIALSLNIEDTDGVLFAGNPARFGQATAGNGMAFGNGKQMRFGRLRLDNAVGSEKLDLPIPIRTEYWTGTAFQTNSADNCTSISAANIGFSNYFGGVTGITAANMNSANISGLGVPFASGAGSLTLTKPLLPVPLSSGAVTLTVNLTAEAKSYLKGNWGVPTFTADPTSRAAFGFFGSQPNNFIYFRENF